MFGYEADSKRGSVCHVLKLFADLDAYVIRSVDGYEGGRM